MKPNTCIALLALLLFSCQSSQKLSQASEDGLKAADNEPSILFVLMHMKKGADGELLFVDEVKSVPGALKSEPTKHREGEHSLRFLFSDESLERADTFWIENPLHRHVEIPHENGTISATTVHVKQAELSLRVTRKSWYRYMVVDAFTKQEKPTLLTSKPYEL